MAAMSHLNEPIQKIVSGGQTGVDRGALDAAIEAGVEHGGWCPLGRRAEDGAIPSRYRMAETASSRYEVRTRQNVADSDATLILFRGVLAGGTRLTRDAAQEIGKPALLVNLDETPDVLAIGDWLRRNKVRTLNVAGPRESQAPGIAQQARQVVLRLLVES